MHIVHTLRDTHHMRAVMGKLKKRHGGMKQTREPPTFDTS
jgi:hypothetical protein